MIPLILLSHGSRHPGAQAGIDALVAAVSENLGLEVRDAHLEFSPRTLQSACSGFTRAVVVPLLFSSGYHARTDVPAALAAAHEATGTELILAKPLGVGEDIAALLASQAPDRGDLVVYPVGSSRAEAQAEYEVLRASVGRMTGRDVAVIPATGPGSGAEKLIGLDAHVLPLFVTDGLLLDKARENLSTRSTLSEPLGATLAPVVTTRYRQAVAA